MPGAEGWLSGPAGPAAAIAAMALASYLCRIAGVLLMGRVRITPALERALAALPGSIVAATVTPLALASGPAAVAGVLAAVAAARLLRHELAALAAGLAVASLARAAGL